MSPAYNFKDSMNNDSAQTPPLTAPEPSEQAGEKNEQKALD